MGILNVTPDSFSDGGAFFDPDAAVAQARHMVAQGADIIDIGGESTRPGADPVSADEECARVVPVIAALATEGGPIISIDTMKASVATAALAAGASIVNDVSAGGFDPAMLAVVAASGAGYVAMHMQGEPRTMQAAPTYTDVVADVGAELRARVATAMVAGIAPAALCADPGIGFGKTTAHNVELLAHLAELREMAGIPLLLGTSRKRFLGTLSRPSAPLDVTERAEATTASVVWCLAHGAAVVRVHDVAAAVAARRTWMRAQLQQSGKR